MLKFSFMKALLAYYKENARFPENIVVFRDGVGDGQLETTRKYEVEQFKSVFSHFKMDKVIVKCKY